MQFCKTSFKKWTVKSRADGLVPMCFAIFPRHVSKVPRLQKSDVRSLRSAAPFTQNNFSKPADLMLTLQKNATPPRRSAPYLPTSLMQISLVLPLQITFCSLLARCRIHCACQRTCLFNIQKWSEQVVFLACSLRHVLCATAACNCWLLMRPDGSAPATLASLLFDPPELQNIGKKTVFRNVSTFSRTLIFFHFFLLTLSSLTLSLLTLSLLWLLHLPRSRKLDF